MAGQGILPTTNTSVSGMAGNSGKIRAILSQASDSTRAAFAQQRPWSELMDRNSFRKPESWSDALDRIKKNLSYFRTNYALFLALSVGATLLWHPISLIVLLLLLTAWVLMFFSRTDPVVLFNRSFSDSEILAILGIATIVVVFVTNVGSVVFSALAISAAIVCIHAAFRVPDDLFLDGNENASASFLNYAAVSQ